MYFKYMYKFHILGITIRKIETGEIMQEYNGYYAEQFVSFSQD